MRGTILSQLLLLTLAGETRSRRIETTTTTVAQTNDQFWSQRHFRRNLEDHETACIKDEDCPDHPWNVCGIQEAGICGHKGIFPVLPLEVAGIIVFAMVMALSNVAGIGGGQVAIPIIIALFTFSTKPAIALASFAIFINTLVRFFINFRERHPEKDNVVVIDYNLVSIMMPTCLCGAQIGAFILILFPSIIIQIILTLMMFGLTIQSTFKAISITKKENKSREEAKVAPANPTDLQPKGESQRQLTPDDKLSQSPAPKRQLSSQIELKSHQNIPKPIVDLKEIDDNKSEDIQADPLESDKPSQSTGSQSPSSGGSAVVESDSEQSAKIEESDNEKSSSVCGSKAEDAENYDKTLRIIVEPSMDKKELDSLRTSVLAEASHFQWIKQGLCIFLLFTIIIMNLCMGSSKMDSIIGVKRCSPSYWAILGVFMVICVICTIIAVKVARRDQNLKIKYGNVNVCSSDIRYNDNKKLTWLIMLGFVGGWVAGALGLGGGSVYNPSMLALGIPPKVSSATGLYLITFSKIASVFIYFLNDQLDITYGLWIGFWSCIGMIIGLLVSQYYMKKTGRQSIIVWCLVAVFAVSVIAVPTFGGISLKKQSDEGVELMAFGDICSNE